MCKRGKRDPRDPVSLYLSGFLSNSDCIAGAFVVSTLCLSTSTLFWFFLIHTQFSL